jgi:putative lipoprotein
LTIRQNRYAHVLKVEAVARVGEAAVGGGDGMPAALRTTKNPNGTPMNGEGCASMTLSIDVGTRTFACVALTAVLALIANQAMAQTIQGTATYRERMTLPPGAVLEAAIEDVSRADAPASVVASTRVASPGNPPIAFTIAYDSAKILPDHRYVVRVRILLDGKLLFTSDVATPVITRGSPTSVSMTLRRVGAGQTASASNSGLWP